MDRQQGEARTDSSRAGTRCPGFTCSPAGLTDLQQSQGDPIMAAVVRLEMKKVSVKRLTAGNFQHCTPPTGQAHLQSAVARARLSRVPLRQGTTSSRRKLRHLALL